MNSYAHKGTIVVLYFHFLKTLPDKASTSGEYVCRFSALAASTLPSHGIVTSTTPTTKTSSLLYDERMKHHKMNIQLLLRNNFRQHIT